MAKTYNFAKFFFLLFLYKRKKSRKSRKAALRTSHQFLKCQLVLLKYVTITTVTAAIEVVSIKIWYLAAVRDIQKVWGKIWLLF